ncbi:uncharacterized protein G2W53_013240 [Senna tora]|uniref:Uncharacterized protein n=1 Tax=Senna tora TaxID=362788 RepID=A0A834U0C1_9FABA|nr:uncharacterized protein G2W53_013240 [Senna tora]
MAEGFSFPNVYLWIHNLPPISEWSNKSCMTLCLCNSSTSSQPTLNLTISKTHQSPPKLSLAIVADFNIPVSLWASKPIKPNSESIPISNLLISFIEAILHYGSSRNTPCIKFPKLDSISNLSDIFNHAFLTLVFLVCIYESPTDLRSGCIAPIKDHLAGPDSRQASRLLMKLLGSNLEEQWMRSVQLYCPVIVMDVENSNSHSVSDERLRFSLRYHQLEGVVQFNYKVVIQEKWVDIMVSIDNIRCDIVKLVNDTLLRRRGSGASEKHFPSRISLQLTPTLQYQVMSVSVGKSSENPLREIGRDKGIEASFEPPNPLGLKLSAGETQTVSIKPWKFEESVYGYSANLNWFLHDSINGKEVFSSKPSKCALMNPRSWFRDRYSSASRPFTRQGGVVFAGDEYGESVWWKVDKGALGKTMEWEIRGWIWLTYWPNKYTTFYNETRRCEFTETVSLNVMP